VARKAGDYRHKLQPIFFELAEANREFETRFAKAEADHHLALKKSVDSKTSAEINRRFHEETNELIEDSQKKLSEINQRYRNIEYNSLAYSYFSAHSVDDQNQGIGEYIHFERHGESLSKTQEDMSHGDVEALKRIQRSQEDYFRAAQKKGPIKAFQGDPIHRQLLELILAFELESLTKEERADCADEYCACGKSHDPDALDKQCRRLKKQLQAVVDSKPDSDPPNNALRLSW